MNFFLIFLCILSASCSKKPAPTDEAKHVDVQEVYAYDVPYIINYPAMVQGVVDYQVIPRISGAIYKKFYKGKPFVRVYDEGKLPQIRDIVGSNYCDIGLKVTGDKLIVVSCIDNLKKGAAGQAVQNMNIMAGFDEAEGLM